jgi:hypothetical protein
MGFQEKTIRSFFSFSETNGGTWPTGLSAARRRVYRSLLSASCLLSSVLCPPSSIIPVLFRRSPGALPGEGLFVLQKTTSDRIFISTNGVNNEEALEENMGDGRGCLFLRCSSKQITIPVLRLARVSRPRPDFDLRFPHPASGSLFFTFIPIGYIVLTGYIVPDGCLPEGIRLFCLKSIAVRTSCLPVELTMKKFSNRTRGLLVFVCYSIDPRNNRIPWSGRDGSLLCSPLSALLPTHRPGVFPG